MFCFFNNVLLIICSCRRQGVALTCRRFYFVLFFIFSNFSFIFFIMPWALGLEPYDLLPFDTSAIAVLFFLA